MESIRVAPGAQRAVIEQSWDGIVITIPAKRNLFVVAFYCVWLCGWTIGWFAAFYSLINNTFDFDFSKTFLFVWLILWTFGGFNVLRQTVYNLFGSEELRFSNNELRQKYNNSWFSKERIYDLHSAKNFRIVDLRRNSLFGFNQQPYRINGLEKNGSISFDYGARTVLIAGDIEEAEARQIIELLQEKRVIGGEG